MKMIDNIELEGYLMKYCNKGRLGGFKKRWFYFNNLNKKLEYFRNKNDTTRIDSIDLRNASFTINCQEPKKDIFNDGFKKNIINSNFSQIFENCCSFKIICDDKVLLLKADKLENCMIWIDKLQSIRKILIKHNNFDDKEQKENKNLDKNSFKTNSSNFLTKEKQNKSFYCDFKTDFWPTEHNDNTFLTSLFNSHENFSSQVKNKATLNLFTKNKKENVKKNEIDVKKYYSNCNKCKELGDQIITLNDDLNAIENEVYGNKGVIKILQKENDQLVEEKNIYENLCKNFLNNKNEKILNLFEKEKEILVLKKKLEEQEIKIINFKEENESLKQDLKSSNNNIIMLREMLQIKDKTVISLTNELFDLGRIENKMNLIESPLNLYANSIWNSNKDNKVNVCNNEIIKNEELKDTLLAFQLQNQFLNKEIVELHELKKKSENMHHKIILECHELEAKCCQIQSKLLSLLKEINYNINENSESIDKSDNFDEIKSKLIAHNDSIKCLVQRLLDENSLDIPINWRPGNRKRLIKNNLKKLENETKIEVDELGFQKENDHENDLDDIFENFNFNFKINDFSNNLQKENHLSNDWRRQWDNFVSLISNTEKLTRNFELKKLLRSGIPQDYRTKIWKLCIYLLVDHKKSLHEPNYYMNIVKSNQQKNLNPSIKQIELDLLRTLPNNRNFESLKCDGIIRLRRVLIAYSQRNKIVGYCQGMNRLAAIALLVLNEEDAFWCLVAIIENIMPKDYYTQTLLSARVDQYVLKDLILEKMPELYSHFEKYQIEISLFSWFLTCFVDNISINILLRIWDVFLYEGSKVLFRFALAFLKYHETNFLSLNNSVAINQYLRIFGKKTYDVEKLVSIAFDTLNPFPMSKLISKRDYYRNFVCSELEESEKNCKTSFDNIKQIDSQSD